MTTSATLEVLGEGLFAYVQPDGSWGLSNAGLVADGGAALLVDTLYDLAHTRAMLDSMARATPAARKIGRVVNTHANGDHCWGNQLVPAAEIVSSRASAEEMVELSPRRVAALVRAAGWVERGGRPARALASLLGRIGPKELGAVAESADFVGEVFGRFDFRGIRLVPPTRTFDGALSLEVGSKRVELFEVGPAHTRGDVIVHVPDDGVVFTGDIVFLGVHPVVWAGPIERWVAALDRILGLAPRVVVPGHGPLTDASGVRSLRDYFEWLDRETRRCFDAGLSVEEAAHELYARRTAELGDAERLVVNVDTAYRDLAGDPSRPHPVQLFARMARFRRELRGAGRGRDAPG